MSPKPGKDERPKKVVFNQASASECNVWKDRAALASLVDDTSVTEVQVFAPFTWKLADQFAEVLNQNKTIQKVSLIVSAGASHSDSIVGFFSKLASKPNISVKEWILLHAVVPFEEYQGLTEFLRNTKAIQHLSIRIRPTGSLTDTIMKALPHSTVSKISLRDDSIHGYALTRLARCRNIREVKLITAAREYSLTPLVDLLELSQSIQVLHLAGPFPRRSWRHFLINLPQFHALRELHFMSMAFCDDVDLINLLVQGVIDHGRLRALSLEWGFDNRDTIHNIQLLAPAFHSVQEVYMDTFCDYDMRMNRDLGPVAAHALVGAFDSATVQNSRLLKLTLNLESSPFDMDSPEVLAELPRVVAPSLQTLVLKTVRVTPKFAQLLLNGIVAGNTLVCFEIKASNVKTTCADTDNESSLTDVDRVLRSIYFYCDVHRIQQARLLPHASEGGPPLALWPLILQVFGKNKSNAWTILYLLQEKNDLLLARANQNR